MDLKLVHIPGATPLNPDEIAGLIPSDIATQGQLNQAEQQNILRGELWVFEKQHKDILNETFIKKLHKKMFADVWRWAGKYRTTNKNIGIDWPHIPEELYKLFADTKVWIELKSYGWQELAVRFHHRLVWIHPFPNGNGRFSRTMTDLLLTLHRQERFTWGEKNEDGKIGEVGPLREKYIANPKVTN